MIGDHFRGGRGMVGEAIFISQDFEILLILLRVRYGGT